MCSNVYNYSILLPDIHSSISYSFCYLILLVRHNKKIKDIFS